MRGVWIIGRRELAGLFLGPLAWVILCVAVFVNGYLFTLVLVDSAGDLSYSFAVSFGGGWPFWAMLAVIPPLLTMRMISEESRAGVLEFLLTAPVSDFAVVAGKLLAATTFMAVLWLGVPLSGVTLAGLGSPPDWAVLGWMYCGAVLASALFCAIGLCASAATQTPLLAAFFALIIDFAVLTLPLVGNYFAAPPGGTLRRTLGYFDVMLHHQGSFLRGVLDTSDLVFFVAWTGFFLFLAARFLESRRWR